MALSMSLCVLIHKEVQKDVHQLLVGAYIWVGALWGDFFFLFLK